jgi:hypothetical protein
MFMNRPTPVQEWIGTHEMLMVAELAFTALVVKAAVGSVAMDDLDAERQELMEMRRMCTLSYDRAFGSVPATSTAKTLSVSSVTTLS